MTLQKGKPLTRELSEMLIDTIYVYDQKHIEVVFKYQDEYKKLLQTLKMKKEKQYKLGRDK